MVNFELTCALNKIFYQSKVDEIKQLSDLMWKEGLYCENINGRFLHCMSLYDEVGVIIKMFLAKNEFGYDDLRCSINIPNTSITITDISNMSFKLKENCYHIIIYDTCDYDNEITQYFLKTSTCNKVIG
ncbi:MAG: hypothetical protein M0R51_16485 [Clostridia bacterium]|jgi:hypothetical protein|nr:hypothetical protein [Clostridia bacterium]